MKPKIITTIILVTGLFVSSCGGSASSKKNTAEKDTITGAEKNTSSGTVLISPDGSDNNNSNNTGNNGQATSTSSGNGTISFSMDGSDWKNNKAEATQTGTSILNIASDDNQTEAISIILNHPITGTFNLNGGVSGSYTDASGDSYGSKDGSGQLIVTKFTPAPGKTSGWVEGTFSGTFAFDATKKHIISNGKFSMPVKQLY